MKDETSGKDTGEARFVVDVPSPKVTWLLGKGTESFGYRGANLKATHNLYQSIGKDVLFENGGSFAQVSKEYWSSFAKKEITLSTNSQLNLASKRITIVAAGAGYGEDTQTGVGDGPPIATFNPSDFQDIVKPCESAVSLFEQDLETSVAELEGVLGYLDPPNPAAAAANVASRLQRLKAFLMGSPPKGTAHTGYVNEFLPETHGLFGMLGQLGSALDKVDRALQRPDNLLLVGPLIQKANQARDALAAATEAGEGAKTLVEGETYETFVEDSHNELKGFEKDVNKIYGKTGDGKKDDPELEWTDKAKAVGALFTSDVAHLVRPLRNLARNLRSTILAVQEVAEAVGQFLHLSAPPPSALGLVAKHGVSVLTPDRFFAYAKSGFQFISHSPPAAAPDGLLDQLYAADQKMRDVLTMKPERPPNNGAGFYVDTSGPVNLGSNRTVQIRANGTLASLGSRGIVDIASGTGAVFRSKGDVEVMGQNVAVGVPDVDSARSAAAKNLGLIAAVALEASTRVALDNGIQQVQVAQRAVDRQVSAYRERYLAAQTMPLPQQTLMLGTLRSTNTAVMAGLQARLDAVTLTKNGLEATHTAAQLALDTARNAAAATSGTAIGATLGLKDAGTPVTQKASIAAVDETTVYGGSKVTVEGKAISLETKDPVVPLQTSSVKLATSQIEITVGNAKVTVAETGPGASTVTIAITGGPQISVTATSITLDGRGTSAVKIANTTELTFDALGVTKLDGNIIQLG